MSINLGFWRSLNIPSKRKIGIFFFTFICAVLAACYLMTINAFSPHPVKSDFGKFYMSGKFFLEGKDIYTPVPVGALEPGPVKTNRETLHPNLNPPFQTLLMAPLSLCPYPVAYWLWSILSLACGMAATTLIIREYATKSYDALVILGAWIILLAYFPTYMTIIYGQFSLIILLALVIAWIASKRGNDLVAGIVLGLAISLKIFMGLFIILFAVRRRWRLLGWMITIFLICNVVGLLVLGVSSYVNYYQILSNVTWYGASWNASFRGFLTRIFGGTENTPLWQLPWLGKGLANFFSLILLLGLVRLAWPRSQGLSEDQDDLVYSWTIVAMLLISPLGWMYYFPCLLIPLVVGWHFSQKTPYEVWLKLTIVSAWILSTIPHWLIPSAEMNEAILWFGWAGCYFYALLLFSGVLIVLSRGATKSSF